MTDLSYFASHSLPLDLSAALGDQPSAPPVGSAINAETLRFFSVFADLDLSQRERLLMQMQAVNVPKRTMLLTAGQPGNAVYFLLEGSVRICLERPTRARRKTPEAQNLAENPRADSAKADSPKADSPKADSPKADSPKADSPKADSPKADSPKADSPVEDPHSATGTQVLLNLCGPGAVLGELSVIDGMGHSASVITRQKCRLLWMSQDAFQEALREMPAIPLALLRECSQRLRNATDQLHTFATLDATGRIAHCLLRLARRYGTLAPDGLRLDIHLTQPELADLTGLTRTRVNTVLGEFKKQGWCSPEERSAFVLHDVASLAALAHLPMPSLAPVS